MRKSKQKLRSKADGLENIIKKLNKLAITFLSLGIISSVFSIVKVLSFEVTFAFMYLSLFFSIASLMLILLFKTPNNRFIDQFNIVSINIIYIALFRILEMSNKIPPEGLDAFQKFVVLSLLYLSVATALILVYVFRKFIGVENEQHKKRKKV